MHTVITAAQNALEYPLRQLIKWRRGVPQFPNESKKRRIMSSSFYAQGDFIVYQVAADSFLWKMVRSIVGTLLELEEQRSGPAVLAEVITGRDRSLAGQTAPARGLFLEKVGYGGKEYPY